ncbi:MAG: c-type cytochrome [Gammaproteobacteria bacterium]|nr:c-type cytochrome [Gammaproteobacteria bacterium]
MSSRARRIAVVKCAAKAMTRILNTIISGIVLLAGMSDAGAQEVERGAYRVVDGKVDAQTFLGWNMYQQTCIACHGADGLGSAVAPDLTVAAGRMSAKEFEVKVLNRYLIPVSTEELASESGRAAVHQAFLEWIGASEARSEDAVRMPVWENNPAVRERIDALYSYLKARSDGALGPGRPELIK